MVISRMRIKSCDTVFHFKTLSIDKLKQKIIIVFNNSFEFCIKV